MKWLDSALTTEQIKELIKPFPEEKMTAYTISKNANNALTQRDYPEILKPVLYPELQEEENLLF